LGSFFVFDPIGAGWVHVTLRQKKYNEEKKETNGEMSGFAAI
jgi:hypothetical protein